MELIVGLVGFLGAAVAVVWAVVLTRQVRRAGANHAPEFQENPVQRLVWCAVILVGIAGFTVLTTLSTILISDDSGGYSAVRTAVTGMLDAPCCELGASEASGGQRAFAFAQSFGVIVLAGVLSWLVVRRGQRIASTAIAAHKGALTR